MPVWLIKILPYGLAALAILGAVWYIDHQGYKRAQTQAQLQKAQDDQRQAEANLKMERAVGDLEKQLQSIVTQHDAQLYSRLSGIDTTNKTIIQPTITREIQNAPRLSDPNLGITDGLLHGLNRARSLSWPDGACVTAADGSTTCALPPARPVEGQEHRNDSH